MSLVTNWITKLPRLKNSKVARFSYKAEAYANDDIEGVENYDYSRDMNVPLATHTDFDPAVLSIGARTHFSSVTKNGLNHFFGRVSYNLNKVLDFLVDFLTDFIALNDSFISFTEIVTFTSSATLSNYANGSTKRLLSTAGSTITITLPAGETYLGSNTIPLAPSIMLTVTKRGTVWVNSSGNAITALTADKWKTARNVTISDADGTNAGTAVPVDGSENETLKLPSTIKATLSGKSKDSYPIPTDAVLQYSFDEIKQLPDNPTGTVYKRDNDWTTVDGWGSGHPSITTSIENQSLKVVYDGTRPDTGLSFFKSGLIYNGKFIVGRIKSTVPIVSICYYNGTVVVNLKLTNQNAYETVFYGYMSSTTTTTTFVLYVNNRQLTAKTCWIESLYIGDGSYLEPVIDNSYSESHAENHGVIPVDGVCGKAGYFNNSYMIAPRPALADDITVYFWAKFDALGTQTIVQSRTVVGQGGLSVFQITNSYRLVWRGDVSNFTGYTPPVNTWHHVCVKMNATTKVLKVNGELKSTLTGAYGTTANLASTIWSGMLGTGGTPSDDILTGALDGLKIVPRFTTDDEDIGEYKARANHPKFYATADKWKTARTITISDADGTNTGTAVSVDGSENETLKLPPTIKATLSGNAATADKWKTARNVTISDADGTNTGTAVSVDGSENETLKLPSTIKASLSGNAASASKWVTPRYIALTGAVTGSVSIDGTESVSMATTLGVTLGAGRLTEIQTPLSSRFGPDGWLRISGPVFGMTAQVGTGLTITGIGTDAGDPALCSLNSTDVAFINRKFKSLRVYRWSGSTWSQVGTGLTITGTGVPALCSLNSTDVAFIARELESLRVYRWSGSTWSQVGTGLTITGTGVPALCSLNSTDVAFIDYTLKSLRVYRWSGSTWSQVGTGLTITGIGSPALCSLNSTDVAFIDGANKSLRVYRWSESTWSQVGTGLTIVATGNVLPALCSLNSTDVAFIDTNLKSLRVYRWSGSTWSQVGTGLTITGGIGLPAICSLNSTDVAFIDSNLVSLMVYKTI